MSAHDDQKDATLGVLRQLAARLRESGSDPNVVYVHVDVAAQIQAAVALAERRARHWYWRLWWRITGDVKPLVDRYNAWRDEVWRDEEE